MPITLSSRHTLLRLKREAKALLAAARSGHPEALARLSALFASATPSNVRLAQAQTVLARSYGLASWPALGRAVANRAARMTAKSARRQARVDDANTLAQAWFALAEQADLNQLWRSMTVAAGRAERARDQMRTDRRYGMFVDVLITGLAHPNARLRFEYAHALDTFGDARCVEPLRVLIEDPVPRVRWMAMHALTCHACGPQTCSDDPALLQQIARHARHDASLKVRCHATVALGLSGAPQAAQIVEDIAIAATQPTLRRAAAFALRKLTATA